jgi:hypothetical protein
MNVELLRKVKAHILAEPLRLVMSTVVASEEDGDADEVLWRAFPACGTVACIAGWACILSGISPRDASMSKAEGLLHLDVLQANRLFEPEQWPREFSDGITDDGEERTARACAARIEHFIKTKGCE